MSAKKTFETRNPAPSITPRRIPQVTAPIAARLGPSVELRRQVNYQTSSASEGAFEGEKGGQEIQTSASQRSTDQETADDGVPCILLPSVALHCTVKRREKTCGAKRKDERSAARPSLERHVLTTQAFG